MTYVSRYRRTKCVNCDSQTDLKIFHCDLIFVNDVDVAFGGATGVQSNSLHFLSPQYLEPL